MKTNKSKKMRSFIILAISIFAVTISMYFYSPVLKTSAVGSYADVDVSVRSVISLTTDVSSVSFDITPTSAGVFDSKPVVATVTTNSSTGYELYFSSIDNETDMTSEDSNETIKSDFSGTVTSSTMAKNKWAYSLDNTNFSKIPTLASAVKVQDLDHIPTSSEGTTTFNIATKIDNTIAPGAYYKKVLVSAVARTAPVPTIHSISTMQQMTSMICENTTTPTTSASVFDWDGSYHDNTSYVPRTKLRDTRDNNYYLVSKLADGNCWMSQNLALDLSSNTALLSSTTDLNLKDSWTPERSTFTTVPDASTWPTSTRHGEAASSSYSYHPIASERYFRNGITKSSSPTANTDEYLWESAGNYYNWFSATAGTGTYERISGNAEDSICPRGWRLPEVSISSNKSYYYAFDYTYAANGTTIVNNPLNFVAAGYYDHTNDQMAGHYYDNIHDGRYWMNSTTNNNSQMSSAQSFELRMIESGSTGGISTGSSNFKGNGLSVRCIAR
jgi:uncharacterized protein (TIGR02145 family)